MYRVCGAAGRCIPVRATSAGAGVDGIEVLLITSSGGKGLVFPKVRLLSQQSPLSGHMPMKSQATSSLLAQAGVGAPG